MDVIFKGDDNENDKKKKKKKTRKEEPAPEQKKDGEESVVKREVVILRDGKDYESEREKEFKSQAADMIPDEYFETMAKSGRKKPGCFKFAAIGMVIVVALVTAILLWGIKFLGRDILSFTPIHLQPVKISEEEKKDLDKKIGSYTEKLSEARYSKSEQDFDITLTGEQLNYLLMNFEESLKINDKIYLRMYPSGAQNRIEISLPYSDKAFMNAYMVGKSEIHDYNFEMEIYSIGVGKLKNAERMTDKIVERIRSLLLTYPASAGLPFRIKSMTVESSRYHFVLTISPPAEKPMMKPDEKKELKSPASH